MTAILFGSISTLVDTSEMQREAFNQAFEAFDLGWSWDRDEYLGLLEKSGGRDRIAQYAAGRGQEVDADAVHEAKSTIFRQNLASSGASARPGVAQTITEARRRGTKVAFVTTTSRANVDAVLVALGPDVTRDDFDLVVDVDSVDAAKPDPAAYLFAVESLGEDAEHCVAIEDNVGGVDAAVAAGVACVAFPNENTAGHDFDAADRVVDELRIDELEDLA